MTTKLSDLLDQGRSNAGPDLKALIDQPGRHMDQEAFREFVSDVRLWAMATTGKSGSPHIAPVHLSLI